MHRCPGPKCPTYNRNNQDSPFLQLPGEIRIAIYRQALVRSTPIDLWPHVQVEPSDSSARRLAPQTNYGLVRRQVDLMYVRKQMATGILGACRQIYHEAAAIFWSENDFEFTGQGSWFGLYRFLRTIGPHARQYITAVGVEPPMYKTRFSRDDQPQGGLVYDTRKLDEHSKNLPKMHMVKVSSDVGYYGLAFDLLARDKYLRQLRLIVPANIGVTRVGIDPVWADECFGEGLESLDFLDSIVLVLRAGSRFNVLDYIDQANRIGWDLLIERGCLLNNTPSEFDGITEQQFHPAPRSEYAYLDCMQDLFPEEEEISVHADGGRVKCRHKRLARILRGFGGVPLP
ncbi:MAG: hypothetical protein M1812_000024 [Candelaria pacifica]|nr:MAG: hypothetical protein M1812_000024 [Candelaria pacifica]